MRAEFDGLAIRRASPRVRHRTPSTDVAISIRSGSRHGRRVVVAGPAHRLETKAPGRRCDRHRKDRRRVRAIRTGRSAGGSHRTVASRTMTSIACSRGRRTQSDDDEAVRQCRRRRSHGLGEAAGAIAGPHPQRPRRSPKPAGESGGAGIEGTISHGPRSLRAAYWHAIRSAPVQAWSHAAPRGI